MNKGVLYLIFAIVSMCQGGVSQTGHLTEEHISMIIHGILMTAFQTNEIGDIQQCLQNQNFDSFKQNVDNAINYIEENSVTGKVSATGAAGSCLTDIGNIMKDCKTFTQNVTSLFDIASQLESPYTMYAKALITEGFKGFEATSFLETAVANYKNDQYFDFGRFMGYTMYLLSGGKSQIKPANEALVHLAFTEQLSFYGHFLHNYQIQERGLNKSVRSISTIFTEKIKGVICDKPYNKKDYVNFIHNMGHVHQFMLDTIKEREGVFKNWEKDYQTIKDRLDCIKRLEVCHLDNDSIQQVELMQMQCKAITWKAVGDHFGQLVKHYCKDPKQGLVEKCEL